LIPPETAEPTPASSVSWRSITAAHSGWLLSTARVAAEAAGGEILVSKSVHDAVGDDFAFGAVRKSR
jgi:hypothetical protein